MLLSLLTTFAFGWNLHQINHFCEKPPEVTRAWVPTSFDDMHGYTNVYSEQWFTNTDSVSIFETPTFNTIGLVVPSQHRSMLKKPFKQIDRHYTESLDMTYRYFVLDKPSKKLPDVVLFLQDSDYYVLILASCDTKEMLLD